jgi:hypothetical protein
MRLAAAIPLLLIAAAPMPASAGAADDREATGIAEPWGVLEFDSRRYHVITTLDRSSAESIARHMDRVHDEYARRLARAGFGSPAGPRSPLYLFRTREGYVRFLDALGVDARGTAGLFFWNAEHSGLASYLHGQTRQQMLRVLQHEGFHQFARQVFGDGLPIWVNEGLAEYFGAAILVNQGFKLGQIGGHRLARMQQAIESGATIPFDRLIRMSEADWMSRLSADPGESSLLYDQVWLMTHYLVHGRPELERAFNRYLFEVHRGSTRAWAFRKAFGTDRTEAFEAAWKRYVRQLETDPLSRAAERMSFMAQGLRILHQRGEAVDSMGGLKRRLQRLKFWYRASSHGVVSEYSAADALNFQPPEPAQPWRSPQFQLEPSDDPDLPPWIRLTGLAVDARLVWSRDHRDRLQYEIVFE